MHFDVVSYDEIKDILESKDQSYSSMKDLLRPLYNTGKEFSKVYFLNIDDFYPDSLPADPGIDFAAMAQAGAQVCEKDENALIAIYSNKINCTDENVFSAALMTGWVVYADEDMNDESPITMMLVRTPLQEDVYGILHTKMLEILGVEEAEDDEDDSDEGKVLYYISYAIIDKSSKDSVMQSLRYTIVKLERIIMDESDVHEIYEKLAAYEGIPVESLFVFSFSRLGDDTFIGNVEEDDTEEEIEDNNVIYNDHGLSNPTTDSTMTFYCNRITYKLNGEERVYDSYQNIDLCADESTKLHFAKSIIVQEENLTPDEAAELIILSVEAIDDGECNFGIDDEDEEA